MSKKKPSRSSIRVQETAEPDPSRSVGVTGAGPGGGPAGGHGGEKLAIPQTLPVLPIRGTVVFPGTIVPLGIGRAASRRLLDESLPQNKIIALVAQRDGTEEEPTLDQVHRVGTAGMVLKLIRQEGDKVSIIVHGLTRVEIGEAVQTQPFLRAKVRPLVERPGRGAEFDASIDLLRNQARELIQVSPNAPEQAQTVLMNIEEPGNLADFLAANIELPLDQKQALLEELGVPKRVRTVLEVVSKQLELGQLQQKIQQDVQSSIQQGQRKFYLREQMKAIQRELGEGDEGGGQAVNQIRERLQEADPPEAVMKEAERELSRLDAIPPASPEFSVIVTYLELIADLPWKKRKEQPIDLKKAREILDRDHFDLDRVKRRLVEYLAVRKLNPAGRGPILCFIGPPGVGKTSLGQSIADALGRDFARIALGGIRDEAEVRGHRRTYIGAMPGRIIQELRRAGSNNPVLMLDEIDKLGADFRGDPSSALLEVLDPRQNDKFVDRYLDVPFDLSQVIFIATANYIGNVPPALRDRMEVIDLPGYTEHDKLQIAKRYLVPRQLTENGLKKSQCKWTVEGIRFVIEHYTREAGVRDLERQVGAVCRAIAAKIAGARNGRSKHAYTVDAKCVRQQLGPERFMRELDTRATSPGVVCGLAYTPYGGELLFIEATTYPGKGALKLTGQIGDVMKESVQAAFSLFKSRAPDFGFDVKSLEGRDIHVHVPAGAVPKDGPSAGVAMYTALSSLMLQLPVRARLAMTGEITLRGRVLPIGGVKEKTLAAARAGIKTVLLPKQNERDLEEVSPEVKKRLKFHFVENVDEVLELALGKAAMKRAATRAPEAVKVES